MNRIWLTSAFMATLAVGSESTAQNNTSKCDSVLVRNTIAFNEYSKEKLALYKLVTKENYEEAKTSASGSYTGGNGIFGADYSEFRANRQKLYDEMHYDRNTEAARSLATSTVSIQAIDAWKACAIKENSGLYAYVKDISDYSATAYVGWPAQPGRPPINVVVSIQGEPKKFFFHNLVGEQSFAIARSSPTDDVRVIVNGDSNGGMYQASFLVPGKKYGWVEIVDNTDYPIRSLQYRWGGNVSSAVRVNAERGNNRQEYACARMPQDYFVEASPFNPRVEINSVDAYLLPPTRIGRIDPPYSSGKHEEICFTVVCGNDAGDFATCDAILAGRMKKKITVKIEQ